MARSAPQEQALGGGDVTPPAVRAEALDRRLKGGGRWLSGLFGANGDGADGEALPVVARLAIVYLLLPLAVWLLGWFEWWFGIPAVALLVAGLWRALSGSWRQRIGSAAVALPVFALVCGILTAFGVLDAGANDAPAHRTVLLALAHGDWPTHFADYLSDEQPLLRYYLGYFIVPALAGKWLGAEALNWAVPLWTWGGLALIVALCAQGLPTLRAMLLAAAVFVFFSGMDVLEHVLRDGLPDAMRHLVERFGVGTLDFIRSPTSLEWAAYHAHGIGDLPAAPAPASPVSLEYFPNLHVLAVTPQHFIGGGLTTLLVLRLCDQPRFLAASGIVLVGCVFWSSLLAVGLLPFVGAMLVKHGVRPFLGWRNLLLAPALALPLALYLASGQVDFPSGWLWEVYASGSQLAADMAIFYLAEFLALALVLWWLHPRLWREPLFVAAVAVLLAAPWFWYGGPRFSELERATIPAVFVLAYYAAHAVAARLPEAQLHPGAVGGLSCGTGRWLASDVSVRAVFALLAVVLSLGSVSNVFYLAKLDWLRVVPIGQLSPALLTDFELSTIAQRTAWAVPDALSALLREGGDDRSLGALVIRSDYDVYHKGNWLVYVKRDCDRKAEARRRFRLRVHSVGGEAASPGLPSAATSLDFPLRLRFMSNGNFPDAGRGGCVVRARLPDGGIARIHTGQHEADGAVLWEAGYDFKTKRQFSAPDFHLSEYRAIVAGSPAARSVFDVYFDGGLLAFVKASCSTKDVDARFMVHLFPTALNDLPDDRQRYGFDNLDFDFGERGVSFDGKCFATIRLPHYALDRVSAGQYVRAERRVLWQVGFPASASGRAAEDPRTAPVDVKSRWR